MTKPSYNVLFLCTGNSARSIMAECILNHEGSGRFRAYSAGSHPRGEVHPMALETLRKAGHDVTGLRSKGWDEFAGPDAPSMDFIFTVCDSAAGEICPVWPGHPATAHWGIEDPAAVVTPGWEQARAFGTAYRYLARRITLFASLSLTNLSRAALAARLKAIGDEEGASQPLADAD